MYINVYKLWHKRISLRLSVLTKCGVLMILYLRNRLIYRSKSSIDHHKTRLWISKASPRHVGWEKDCVERRRQQFDPRTGFLSLDNELGDLTMSPVYIITKLVHMVLWDENAAPGTGFYWLSQSFCDVHDLRNETKALDYDIQFYMCLKLCHRNLVEWH